MKFRFSLIFSLIFIGLMFLGLACADLPHIALRSDEASLPRTLDLDVLNRIKKRVTTQNDILNLLGEPQEKGLSHTDQGKEEFWVYIYDQTRGGLFGQNEGIRDVLRIAFREKVVQEWEHTRFFPGAQPAGTKRAKEERLSVIADIVQQGAQERDLWLKGIITEEIEKNIPIRRAWGFTRGEVLMQSFCLSDEVNSILVFRFYNERRKIEVKKGKTVAKVTGRYIEGLFDSPVMIAWDDLLGRVDVNQPWLVTLINRCLSKPGYQASIQKCAQLKPRASLEVPGTSVSPPMTPSGSTKVSEAPNSHLKVIPTETSHLSTLSVKPVSGSKDALVTVLVQMDNAPKAIEAFGFKLNFDAKVLEYIGVTPTELTRSWASLNANCISRGAIIVGGYNLESIPQGSSGAIASLNFRVICSTCQDGDISNISLSELTDDLKGWETQKGTFTFIAHVHDGDVNGDNTITPADALLVLKHYLGVIKLTDQSLRRGDSNGDGEMTPADARGIFKEYLGGSL